MPVRKYNKYSAYYDTLNDHKAAYNLEKEQLYDTIEEVKNNSFKGKTQYEARILEAPVDSLGGTTSPASNTNAGSKKVFFAKVRLNDVEENMLQEPSQIADPRLRNRVIAQHKTALFSPPDGEDIKTMAPGDVVECNFSIDGPDNEGRQRGLQLTSNVVSRGSGNYSYTSTGAFGAFGAGSPTILSPDQQFFNSGLPPVSLEDQIPGANLPVDFNSRNVTRITSRVGPRISPISGKKVNHNGTDIGAVVGTPLYASFGGEVYISEGITITGEWKGGGFGNWVVLKHENVKTVGGEMKTLYLVYGHLDGSLVTVGQKVTKGQAFATTGNKGRSTGPHLHLEAYTGWPRSKDKRLDPVAVFGWESLFSEKGYYKKKEAKKKEEGK